MTTKAKVWKARPTTYRGVEMRSRLEAAWAEQFDAWALGWEYEPRCYATEEGQYLPDFELTLPRHGDTKIFVEVKPYEWTDRGGGREANEDMCRMFRILQASRPDARFWLVTGASPEDGFLRVVEVFKGERYERLSGVDFSSCTPVSSLHAEGFFEYRRAS